MAGDAHIDLNADVGEGFGAWAMGPDADLLALVTSVNVACGFHGGDPAVMDRTVAAAARAGVALGAHPGYFDLRGFGRRPMAVPPAEVETDVLYQVGALMAFARSHGARVVHVKPHGALYNMAAKDAALSAAIARGVRAFDPELTLVGLAGSELPNAGAAIGLRVAHEAFADRRYERDGSLTPRGEADAVIDDVDAAVAQAVRIAANGTVRARDGSDITLRADTICIHGDSPGAAEMAKTIRERLQREGIDVKSMAGIAGSGPKP